MSPIDKAVGSALARGDHQRAAEAVMREYGPAIRGLLQAGFREDAAAAEDAFSLFAETLWQYMPTFRAEASVRTWAYCLARTAAVAVRRDFWRAHGQRLGTVEGELLAEPVRTMTQGRHEHRARVFESLRKALDLDEQTLLTLRLDEQMSWDEVAEVMSSGGEAVEATTVRKRFERLKEKLADLARAEGLLE